MAGVATYLAGKPRAGGAIATAAAGLKASAGLVVPYLIAGAHRVRGADPLRDRRGSDPGGWRGVLVAAVATALGIGLLALVGFGTHALDALGLLSSNQDRTSRWSFPYKTAQLLGALLPGDRLDYRFEATQPVRFALQYRNAGAVVEPLVREASTGDGAVYPVVESWEYCLTWEAGAAGASLTYRVVAR